MTGNHRRCVILIILLSMRVGCLSALSWFIIMTLKTEICNAFNAHAKDYDEASPVQREIGERLFERLQYLAIKPRYVLDLGCGPGYFSKQLKKQYPAAQVVGLDMARAMLVEAKAKQTWRRKWSLVNGDMTQLPFASGLFDLVFANQVIHWSTSLLDVFSELNRVMNTNGCLMFSTLGPSTFQELRQAWAHVDTHAHVNDFVDMHDVGDALLGERFLDPVVDMEVLTAHYKRLSDLLGALKAQGVRNVNASRHSGLTGKRSWRAFEQAMLAFRTEQGQYRLTYEVVYGHAWKGSQRRLLQGTEVLLSVDALRKTMPVKAS